MIRVLLADDHAIVVEGLRALLDGEPDITVAGWTTDGTEVVKLVQQHKPDVVVLDLELTTIKGTEVLAALRDRPAPPKVLVLTAYNDGESLRSALDAGADGLALKTESPQQTLTAIRQVHAGQLVFPQAARRWIEGRAAKIHRHKLEETDDQRRLSGNRSSFRAGRDASHLRIFARYGFRVVRLLSVCHSGPFFCGAVLSKRQRHSGAVVRVRDVCGGFPGATVRRTRVRARW